MIKLKKAEFIGYEKGRLADVEVYQLKHKEFTVEFLHERYYSEDEKSKPNGDWWIYDVKFFFKKKELTEKYEITKGGYLYIIQNEINLSASEYIKERYKEFL